ncbi:MAG: hydroxylase [Deltaproteobacteria bacterium]|nr:hydroxylase [Deltaproteobacteria bacterium]
MPAADISLSLSAEPLSPTSLLETAQSFAPRIRLVYEQIEADRRLPPALVKSFAHAGLFRLLIPQALGGLETDAVTALQVFEEMAKVDGSVGWSIMIGATGGLVSAYLAPQVAWTIYGSDPQVITGGALSPTGKAVAVDGGYRVTGHWQFNSGCQHCSWLMGTCIIFDGDTPRKGKNGETISTMMIFPATDVEIIDTWLVSGLRGSGSHDIVANDVFVPNGYHASLVSDHPFHDGPLYRFPMFGLLAVSVASVALGIARGAINTLREMAPKKRLTTTRKRMAEREVVQMQVAQAEGLLRSGRAFLFDTVQHVWNSLLAQETPTLEQRALLRLAATQATTQAAQAIDLMYHAAGTSSIWAHNPLQRYFRDVHVVTQHAILSAPIYELTGRVFIGQPTETSML